MKTKMRPSLVDTQVRHMSQPHHPDTLYSSLHEKPAIKQIESSDTPSKNYKKMVNDILAAELRNSMSEFEKRKAKNTQQKSEFYKGYLDDCSQNSLQIEKNMMNRQNYYNRINNQQNQRAKEFVDAPRNYEKKVNSFIESNIDPRIFSRFQEQYNQQYSNTKKDYVNTLENQVKVKLNIQFEKKIDKENQLENRLKLMERINQLEKMDVDKMKQSKIEYKTELDRAISLKQSRGEGQRLKLYEKETRHNPITNPIEFHVENPYILKSYVQKIYPNKQ